MDRGTQPPLDQPDAARPAPPASAWGALDVGMLWRSPTLRTVVVIGLGGVGFAGANLILARVLPTTEYALFTLVLALSTLGYALAPAGVDEVVNRRHLEAGPALLSRMLVGACLVGVALAALGALVYDMPPSLVFMLYVSAVAGGAMQVAGSQFQSEQRFGRSLALIHSPNLVLLVAAMVVVATGIHRAWLAILVSTLGLLLAALGGWAVLFNERWSKPHRESWFPWSEALSLAGLNAAGVLLVQLERLVIPQVLPLQDLATYGVLAAIVGSLFRVLQMGVGYSLVPRLRAARDVSERRRLIAHEARLVSAIILAGSVLIWLVTPAAERWFLAGKYHLPPSLVLAAIVSGVAKILNAFSKAAVTALAEPQELSFLNVLGWVSVGVGILAAGVGARWLGLAGVLYGVGVGWLLRAMTALYLTSRHLHMPDRVPATAR